MRLDIYLTQKGLVKSRQKAKSLIESGSVLVNGRTIAKASYDIDEAMSYEIKINDTCPYVSRGGLKLAGILDYSKISVENKICLDIGASTGGFTDCLLKYGAKHVFAVDSGSLQLDESLRCDKRVTSLENYNARQLLFDDFGQLFDIVTIDVSFISQTLIFPSASKLINEDGLYISLIKPQFEAGKDKIGKGGVVKNSSARLFAVKRVVDFLSTYDYFCTSLIKSPIQGGDGNIEYLAVFKKDKNAKLTDKYIENTVLNS